MGVRSSQLVIDLEAAIAATRDPHEADALRADLAAQWARLGREDEAEGMLVGLRGKYGKLPHPRVTPWLNFAEATLDLRVGRGAEALVKMRRAHALSVATDLAPLSALAAATLAHLYWGTQDIETATRHAREALMRSRKDDHRSRCRASMVVGEILGMSGEAEAAIPWFAKARRHASATGDDAAKSALTFNLSVVSLALLKQARFDRNEVESESKDAESQRKASNSLDALFQISVDDLSILQQAQLQSLTNRPLVALIAYAKLNLRAKFPSAARQRAVRLSDEAWCHARVGQFRQALGLAQSAESEVVEDTQIDDRAAMHSRLSLVYSLIGDPTSSELHRGIAVRLWKEYREFQQRCAVLCLTISENG